MGGIDAALQSSAVGHDGAQDIRTFFHLPQTLEQARLAHPKYATANTTVDWNDEIKSRRDSILAEFNK